MRSMIGPPRRNHMSPTVLIGESEREEEGLAIHNPKFSPHLTHTHTHTHIFDITFKIKVSKMF
jgi:hypothetical protein